MFTISKFGVCVCWSGLDNGGLLFICVWSPSSLGFDGCLLNLSDDHFLYSL